MHAWRLSPDMEMTAVRTRPAQLSLGPLLYYWPRQKILEFYEQAESWPVDSVYLGETVCSKRFELRMSDWLRIARRLADKGKTVILSTCELIESEADLRTLRKITGNSDFLVEANDLGAVHMLAGKTPFVAGPFLNIYSGLSLAFFHRLGASRWVMPIELSHAGLGDVLRDVVREMNLNIETEVFSYGRLPLAVSARCFTARYHNLSKDDCGFRCLENPDGLTVSTQDDESFLALNGLQTQSARVYNLINDVADLIETGVNHIRISPQSAQTGDVVAWFEAAIGATLSGAGAQSLVEPWAPDIACNGYWHGRPGLEQVNIANGITTAHTQRPSR